METLALHNDATIVHWEYNTRCISVVVAKIFTSLELNAWKLLFVFYKNNFTMLFLLQNMRSLVS